jgi:hypothetical protein
VILRHSTPARNLPSILRAGLLTSRAEGKLAAVWLTAPSRTTWAVLHAIKRHGGRVETTVVLELDVPRSWVRRSARKRVWYSMRDIPPERIKHVFCFSELAGASLEE